MNDSTPPMPTKERLALAIEAQYIGKKFDPRVSQMIRRARRGYYDDYESEIGLPLHALISDLHRVGFNDLAQRVMDGEFDGSKEEGEAWMEKEGWGLLLGKEGGKG